MKPYRYRSDWDTPYTVIGVIDGYGAIHHRPVTLNDVRTHSDYWPTQYHKRWRFIINEWQLENSVLSKENLNEDEKDMICNFMRKHYNPPLWFIKGEEWEALGRPREGKAHEEHERKWDKIYKSKTS